ncbi:MAG: hypothetical protein ACFNM6_02235 [Prevotella sp.]
MVRLYDGRRTSLTSAAAQVIPGRRTHDSRSSLLRHCIVGVVSDNNNESGFMQ